MHCQELKNKLPDYIDQLLDKQEVKPIKDHLKTCRACQKEYRLYSLAVAAVSGLPLLTPSPEFNSRVFSALGLEYRPAPALKWQGWAIGLGALVSMWLMAALAALGGTAYKLGPARTLGYMMNPGKIAAAGQIILAKIWFGASDAVSNIESLLAFLLRGTNFQWQLLAAGLLAFVLLTATFKKTRPERCTEVVEAQG
jgi:predicted anti-sigma-YlaC factor YlaD